MLDNKGIAEPRGVGLDIGINPLLCPWGQWAKQKQGSLVNLRAHLAASLMTASRQSLTVREN